MCIFINIVDNDGIGILVVDTDGKTEVAEGGVGGHPESDTVTIELLAAPQDDVVIRMYEADADPNDLIFEPGVITFTSDDWNIPAEVTITAIDDDLVDQGTQNVDFIVVSNDLAYDDWAIDRLAVIILDNNCGIDPFNSADINEDCRVDMQDLAIIALQWMTCTFPNMDGCP